MHSVEDIKAAIETLPGIEFASLRTWILEKDWESWDQEIKIDSERGKLNFLLQEAETDLSEKSLKDS